MAILSRRTLTWAPGLTPSLPLRSITTRLVSTKTTKPRLAGSAAAPAACVVPPFAAAAPALGGGGAGSTDTAIFWRGLMRPPPGGEPYLGTISGGAMRLSLPKIRVPIVVGTLSSSTQMYSGSLGTSPKRGFLMRSHLFSAALILIVGSLLDGSPANSRRLGSSPQPERTAATSANVAKRRSAVAFMGPQA